MRFTDTYNLKICFFDRIRTIEIRENIFTVKTVSSALILSVY